MRATGIFSSGRDNEVNPCSCIQKRKERSTSLNESDSIEWDEYTMNCFQYI